MPLRWGLQKKGGEWDAKKNNMDWCRKALSKQGCQGVRKGQENKQPQKYSIFGKKKTLHVFSAQIINYGTIVLFMGKT